MYLDIVYILVSLSMVLVWFLLYSLSNLFKAAGFSRCYCSAAVVKYFTLETILIACNMLQTLLRYNLRNLRITAAWATAEIHFE